MENLSFAYKYFYFILRPDKGRSAKSFLNNNQGIASAILFDMLLNDIVYFENDAFHPNEGKLANQPFYTEVLKIANQPSEKSLISVGQLDNITQKSDVMARLLASKLVEQGVVKTEIKKGFFGGKKEIFMPADANAQQAMFAPMVDKLKNSGEYTEEEMEMIYLIYYADTTGMLKKFYGVDMDYAKMEAVVANIVVPKELSYFMQLMDKVQVDYLNRIME